ncbi:V-type ATP synthase subunit F [Peptoniphilus sp. GNH]|nr:ATP synthase, subunit F [Clostridiales bacterium KA00134]UHR02132.1 V-type ATP synthase subunit F [Peptoniphilus sp. GNH]
MKSLVISRNRDVTTGLRLSGIDGLFCKNTAELKSLFKKNKDREDLGIIILTERDSNEIKEDVIEKKLSGTLPLVVTIPGPKGIEDKDFILRYVKESVGIKL